LNYLKLSFKRWIAWLLIATAFAVSCVFLSQWQFDRRAHRVAEIALVEKNFDASAVPLDVDTAVGQPEKLNDLKWHPITVSGHYLPSQSVLVRNRPKSGQPGFESVVPFVTDAGVIFAVSRGWLPTGNLQDSPDSVPLPTDEAQKITARLVPSEPKVDREAPKGQAANLHLPAIAEATGLELNASWYLIMDSESMPQAKPPGKLLRPTTDEGNHLSYALQWILFGILAFVALLLAIKREYEFYLEQTDPSFVRRKKRATRSDKDNDAEDGPDLLLML
jgi:cytochrome oxidase assembly protein ShyY1